MSLEKNHDFIELQEALRLGDSDVYGYRAHKLLCECDNLTGDTRRLLHSMARWHLEKNQAV